MAHEKILLTLTIFCAVLCNVAPAKILGIFPIPAKSHFNLGSRLMENLAVRGHQVTVLGSFPRYNEIENYTDIAVENTKPVLQKFQKSFYERNSMNFISSTCFLYNMANELTQAFLSDGNVQILLDSDQKFDLIVVEYFMNEAILGIGKLFGAPVVLVSSLPGSTLNNHLFSNPLPSSFVPNLLSEFTGTMSYSERFKNLFYNVFNNNYRYFVNLPEQNKLLRKFVNEDFRLGEIIEDVDLILLNSHPSVTEPIPMTPNMVEIGGLHIYPSQKLSSDIETFMNKSENGVILFSMGSNLKASDLGFDTIKALLKAFSSVEHNILWKFEDHIEELPPNVKLVKWIPQQKILDHSNTKAFISHGGLFSVIEAVYFGIPMIGIPIYGDQKSNVARAVKNGYAISIPLMELSESKLVEALREVIENPVYLNNARKRSEMLRDQPQQPLNKAIYWIEYAIKHNGTKFLQSPGVPLSWYQKHLIDIIVVLFIIDVILFLIFYYIFKHIVHLIKVSVEKRKELNYKKLDKL